MKKKKLLTSLLAASMSVVAAFACFGMTACDGKDKDKDADTNPPATDPSTQDPSTQDPVTPAEDTSTKFTGKIYVVGDSTVCDYEKTQGGLDDAYLPRYGYGTQLHEYINIDKANVENVALSGRSSLSYLQEDYYTSLKSETTGIKSGDYLVIGFGHNDEKTDAGKYTNPTKTYTDSSTANGPSFQYILYENYVKMAKDKGATPILCTPIVRYNPSGSYSNNDSVHVTSNGDYVQAIKTLGSETNTTVIDLTELTKVVYTADNANALYYHYHDSYTGEGENKEPDGLDKTHLNMYGAKMVAYQFAQALKNTDCALKNSVKTNSVAPTKAADYAAAINTDYQKTPYTAPTLTAYKKLGTTQTTTSADWYGTVFGDIGGDTKTAEYQSTYSADKFTVGNNGKLCGKFASGGDGLGVAFVQIDANKDFTASVDIEVKSITSTDSKTADAQSGVGLMIRDDIYNNLNTKTIKSNFIAAGTLANGGGAIFSHEEGTLKTEKNATTVAAGSTFHAEIKRSGTSMIVKFQVVSGGSVTTTYTKTYLDVKLNKIDSNYMYLCLFANRGIVAEFTNVQFAITGNAQGA